MRLALMMLLAVSTVAGAGGCRILNPSCSSCGDSAGRFGNGQVLAAVKQRLCPNCGGDCAEGQCGLIGRLQARGAGALAGGCGPHGCGHGAQQAMVPAGPPSAAYAYPYYTVRGPRDFLQANPMTIGPY